MCGCRFAVTGTLLDAPNEGEDAAGLGDFVNPEPVKANFGQQTGKRKLETDDNCCMAAAGKGDCRNERPAQQVERRPCARDADGLSL
jgi:hypothetical protein